MNSRFELNRVHCNECYFWERMGASNMGTCRIRAPTSIVLPAHVVNGVQVAPPVMAIAVPHTPDTFWCGEGRVPLDATLDDDEETERN